MHTTITRRRRRPPAPTPVHSRADLLALQWTHGIETRLRPVDPDGCTDLADEVRAVVGQWLRCPGSAGRPMPLASVRLWLRMRRAASTGARSVLHTQDADELLCAALASESAGLAVVPLRKRLSA